MVVACHSYTRADWMRMKHFAWITELLHFNRKLLQLPLMVLHQYAGLNYRQIFESYLQPHSERCWMLEEIRQFFLRKAEAASQGETPFCLGPLAVNSPLQVWLEAHDFILMGLLKSQSLRLFYQQNRLHLQHLLAVAGITLPAGLLEDSLSLAQALFFSQASSRPWELRLGWNLWEVYQAWLQGDSTTLQPGAVHYRKDWVGAPFDRLHSSLAVQRIRS